MCANDYRVYVYKYTRIGISQAHHSVGHTKLKLPGDELIKAVEGVFKKFNASQRASPVVKQVGQDIFNDGLSEFHKWIDSLSVKALYKSLIEAHTAAIPDRLLLACHSP